MHIFLLLFLTLQHTNLMILPFFSSANKLSQWLNQCLQRFVANPQIPLRILLEVDHDAGIKNPEYGIWEQQDQVLMTWPQSTISTPILSWMLGCVHSYEVWEYIHEYFHKQTKAITHQLQTQLHSMMLGTKSMCEFLSQLHAIADSLASIWSPMMRQEHVDMILEVLSLKYHSVIVIIESKFETQPLEQVEALLLAHEPRMIKFKQCLAESPLINFTHSQTTNKSYSHQDPES